MAINLFKIVLLLSQKLYHQVVTVSLYKAKVAAHECDQNISEWNKWEECSIKNSDMFHYWNMILDLGILYLLLERASRERDFALYCSVLESILPYAFMLDRINYERWLAVHVDDLQQLQSTNPSLYSEFLKGHFAVSVTGRPFSSIACDQAHEQTNKIIKSYKAALGSDIGSIWNLACPELIRVVGEFEDIMGISREDDYEHRHDDHTSVQTAFLRNVNSAYESIIRSTNPFSADHTLIVFLHNGESMNSGKTITENLRSLVSKGKELYLIFKEERLVKCTMAFTEPVRKNSMLLPGDKEKLPSLVVGLTSYQELAFIQEIKDVVSDRFDEAVEAFEDEPFNVPGAFTKHGESFKASKSAVMKRIHKTSSSTKEAAFSVDGALIVDISFVAVLLGAAGKYVNFYGFCEAIWNYITHIGQNNCRIDIVCDNYSDQNLLKERTRSSRGSGGEIDFSLESPFPKDFVKDFMKNVKNKEKFYDLLISFLHEKSLLLDTKYIFTNRRKVISNHISEMEDCSHLEADYRIVLHIVSAILEGLKRVVVRSNDTDVLIILIQYYNHFCEVAKTDNFNIILMTGKSSTATGILYISIDLASKSFTPHQLRGLPLLFSMAGCDYVESFYDVGQMSWLNNYLKNDTIPRVFSELMMDPLKLIDKFEEVMNFVLTTYKVRNPSLGCSVGRVDTFKFKTIKTLRQLPPSKAALYLHMRRALYVATNVWGRAHIPDPPHVDPCQWGWVSTNGTCVPLWTSRVYDLSNKMRDPFLRLRSRCSCGRSGTSQPALCKNCSCKKLNVKCWKKCGCFGEC